MVIRSRSLDLTDRVCKMFYNARVDRAPFRVVNAMHQANSDTFASIQKRLLHGFVIPEAKMNVEPKGRQDETPITGDSPVVPNEFDEIEANVNWGSDSDGSSGDTSEDGCCG